MTGFSQQIAIVGVAESDLGSVPDKTAWQLQAQAARAALADAGLSKNAVDALFTAGGDQMPTSTLGEYLRIYPKYLDSTMIGGSSFVAHVEHAAAAIHAGLCEVALITYGSTQRSDRSRSLGGGRGDRKAFVNQFESPYGPLLISNYALAANRHMYEFGTTSEQLAEIAVSTRKWAQLNPKAFVRDPLDVQGVFNSPMVADPLHVLDCCLVTDGGGALVVTKVERARDLGKPVVAVLGSAEGHTHGMISQMPNLTHTGAIASGKRAFGMAGLTPNDIDLLMVYDSFTITVLLTVEDLGFCAKGEGGPFLSGGRTAPGGSLPMNTNGGGLSYCHPGMYGIFTVIEAVRQLRGEAGERQVADVEVALCHGTGGTLSTQGTLVLGRL